MRLCETVIFERIQMLMSLYSLQCESSDLSFFYEALKLGD